MKPILLALHGRRNFLRDSPKQGSMMSEIKDIFHTFNKDVFQRSMSVPAKDVTIHEGQVYIDTGREIWHLWFDYAAGSVYPQPMLERVIVK